MSRRKLRFFALQPIIETWYRNLIIPGLCVMYGIPGPFVKRGSAIRVSDSLSYIITRKCRLRSGWQSQIERWRNFKTFGAITGRKVRNFHGILSTEWTQDVCVGFERSTVEQTFQIGKQKLCIQSRIHIKRGKSESAVWFRSANFTLKESKYLTRYFFILTWNELGSLWSLLCQLVQIFIWVDCIQNEYLFDEGSSIQKSTAKFHWNSR